MTTLLTRVMYITKHAGRLILYMQARASHQENITRGIQSLLIFVANSTDSSIKIVGFVAKDRRNHSISSSLRGIEELGGSVIDRDWRIWGGLDGRVRGGECEIDGDGGGEVEGAAAQLRDAAGVAVGEPEVPAVHEGGFEG
ncbi:hypothetical protein Syun_021807 [Stephania yunnanensis]|uniref:Uncharacterized protein n=1 Tax=Stephania yunnanensis TaxID=152371 RepID=A0AAP0IGR8_9MAGN